MKATYKMFMGWLEIMLEVSSRNGDYRMQEMITDLIDHLREDE